MSNQSFKISGLFCAQTKTRFEERSLSACAGTLGVVIQKLKASLRSLACDKFVIALIVVIFKLPKTFNGKADNAVDVSAFNQEICDEEFDKAFVVDVFVLVEVDEVFVVDALVFDVVEEKLEEAPEAHVLSVTADRELALLALSPAICDV